MRGSFSIRILFNSFCTVTDVFFMKVRSSCIKIILFTPPGDLYSKEPIVGDAM